MSTANRETVRRNRRDEAKEQALELEIVRSYLKQRDFRRIVARWIERAERRDQPILCTTNGVMLQFENGYAAHARDMRNELLEANPDAVFLMEREAFYRKRNPEADDKPKGAIDDG